MTEQIVEQNVAAEVRAITDRARRASRRMAGANRAWKDKGLRAIAEALVENQDTVLARQRQGRGRRPRKRHLQAACWTGSR